MRVLASSTSALSICADMRSAPWPRMIICSMPSEVATRTRRVLASSNVAFSMYMSAVSASFVYTMWML